VLGEGRDRIFSFGQQTSWDGTWTLLMDTIPRAGARLPQTDRDAFVLRMDVMHSFRQFPLLDPKLPDKLMDQPMLQGQAVRLFHELWDGLSGQARRHVAHLASGAVPQEGGAG
jgi:DNA-binding transcriptional regulator PaaX